MRLASSRPCVLLTDNHGKGLRDHSAPGSKQPQQLILYQAGRHPMPGCTAFQQGGNTFMQPQVSFSRQRLAQAAMTGGILPSLQDTA